MSGTKTTPEVTIVPANEASWEDLQAVFGTRGDPSRCQCQHYKIRDMEWRSVPVEERAHRLREQTDCGHPESDTTSGLVAYLDGEPVGWCAVEPHGLPAPAAHPRPVDRASGRQDRRRRLGRDLLRHPHGLPAPRRQPRARPPPSTSPGSAAPVPSRATR